MSETKQYDVPEVLAALEAAVAERGEDYVYRRPGKAEGLDCLYVHDRNGDNPTPGCIVGQVYFDLTGALVPVSVEHTAADGTRMAGLRVFTSGARGILVAAQMAQDHERTWGEALREARRTAAGIG